MDLFGHILTRSLGGKRYFLVVIDDYTRYTWVSFLSSKDETISHLIKLFKMIMNEKCEKIKAIRSDHGREFDFLGMD